METFQNENQYKYHGLDFCKTDFSELPKICKMFICTYRINTKGKYPFLEFIMEHMVDYFSFPSFTYVSDMYDIEEVLEKMCVKKTFQGFFIDNEHSEDVYLFFESNDLLTDGDMFYKEDKHWKVTIDEIMNQHKVCNIFINNDIIHFFLNNPFFCFINDEKNNYYEIPVVQYAGVAEPLLKNRTIFGIPPADKTEIMGPYYYFTDFVGAVKQGAWSQTGPEEYKLVTEKDVFVASHEDETSRKYKKGGVIRFALFLGKTLVPMNYEKDSIDESLTKQELLSLDKKHRQTMRISDHDGKWTETHDSVKLGRIELDDGSRLTDSPMWVVGEYDRIVPLSYHFIDKSTLGDVWSRDGDYKIQ